MKKIILLTLLLISVLAALPAAAQQSHHPSGKPDPKMMKEINEYKMKFLAQEMELKDGQKEQFVELYQKFNDERMRNFRKMRQLEESLKNNPSEEDYRKASEGISNLKLADAQLEREYDAKFAKFLSQKQIYKMKEAEEQFRRKMHDMRQKRCGEKKKK